MQGYRPPEPPGARTRAAPTVIIVTLFVLAVGAFVVIAGILLFRVLAAANDDADARRSGSTPSAAAEPTVPATVELAQPLEIRLVTSADPGACPDGSDGLTAPDPPECLVLGRGFSATELKHVEAGTRDGRHLVAMEFPADTADALRQLTEASVGERLALVYDGEVIMAPTVNDAISGGQLEISGNFTEAQAEELAARLRGE